MELLAREVFKGLGPRSSRAGWVPTVAQEPPELMPTFQTPHLDLGSPGVSLRPSRDSIAFRPPSPIIELLGERAARPRSHLLYYLRNATQVRAASPPPISEIQGPGGGDASEDRPPRGLFNLDVLRKARTTALRSLGSPLLHPIRALPPLVRLLAGLVVFVRRARCRRRGAGLATVAERRSVALSIMA
jgi:hypothetical protein